MISILSVCISLYVFSKSINSSLMVGLLSFYPSSNILFAIPLSIGYILWIYICALFAHLLMYVWNTYPYIFQRISIVIGVYWTIRYLNKLYYS